jgi:hypothetical protein
MMMAIAIFVSFGLAAANFAWQALGDQQWLVAFERTWFQATACLAMVFADYRRRSILDIQ